MSDLLTVLLVSSCFSAIITIIWELVRRHRNRMTAEFGDLYGNRSEFNVLYFSSLNGEVLLVGTPVPPLTPRGILTINTAKTGPLFSDGIRLNSITSDEARFTLRGRISSPWWETPASSVQALTEEEPTPAPEPVAPVARWELLEASQ